MWRSPGSGKGVTLGPNLVRLGRISMGRLLGGGAVGN